MRRPKRTESATIPERFRLGYRPISTDNKGLKIVENEITNTGDAAEAWPGTLPAMSTLESAWGKEFLLTRTSSPFGRPLISVRDIHKILCDKRTRVPQLLLIKDGQPVPLSQYTKRQYFNHQAVDGHLDIERMISEMRRGASVRLNDIQKYCDPIAGICEEFSKHVGIQVGAYAFLSPPGHGAAALHQDPAHVIVIQTVGAKDWEVYNHFEGQDKVGPVDLPPGSKTSTPITLLPGDTFYLPPMRPHKAICSGQEWSLHISLTILPTTFREVLRHRFEKIIMEFPDFEIPPRWNYCSDPVANSARAVAKTLSDAPWKKESVYFDTRGRENPCFALEDLLGLSTDISPNLDDSYGAAK